MNPHKYSNVGRFLNSSNNSKSNNCRPRIGLLRYNFSEKTKQKNELELAIYIETTKFIPRNTELKYFYGKKYYREEEAHQESSSEDSEESVDSLQGL